jgi:hypothetical protein
VKKSESLTSTACASCTEASAGFPRVADESQAVMLTKKHKHKRVFFQGVLAISDAMECLIILFFIEASFLIGPNPLNPSKNKEPGVTLYNYLLIHAILF